MTTAGDLHSAGDDPATLRRLIAAGAAIDARDDWDCTALFHAVLAGNLESVEILIGAGADVNTEAGEPGCTILASSPLNLAMQCRNLLDRAKYDLIVKRLEAEGASLRFAFVA